MEGKASAKRASTKGTSTKIAWRLLGAMALMLMLTLLAGCGGKEEEEKTYFEIQKDNGEKHDVTGDIGESEKEGYKYLGSQFWGGVKIQIWGIDTEDGGKVYLHKEGEERELLMGDVHRFFFTTYWWMDNEGRCFILWGNTRIIRPKMDESLYPTSDWLSCEGAYFQRTAQEDEGFLDICQLEDGRIIVLRRKDSPYVFSELDPDSGELTDVLSLASQDIDDSTPLIAPGGSGLLLLNNSGLWDLDLTEGKVECRIPFGQTSFELEPDRYPTRMKMDFRLLEDGRIELLWSDGTSDILKFGEAGEDREILVFRSAFYDAWIKERIVEFNQKDDKYCVVIEERTDGSADGAKSYCEKTDLEIGAGKGADIIENNALNDAAGLLEKGAFADLAPFMEASGLQEGDFFPSAFSGWKKDKGIYGIRVMSKVKQFWLDQAVVGERTISNVEEMIDCLLDYEEEAVLMKGSYYSAEGLLRFFLEHSESLCGMVDFESGTCDFGGELFEKMLKAAKRYGYDERKELKSIGGIVDYHNFYNFCDDEFLSKQGKIPVGFMFDDGGRPKTDGSVLTINANSDKKEGAWRFLCYLLGEEAQSAFYVDEYEVLFKLYGAFPINRNVFEELCGKHEPVINDGVDYDSMDGIDKQHRTGLTEERSALLREALESARPIYFWAEPLIAMITEESGAYFSGDKNIDQVRETIENRVRTYLSERR